jgi:hypothetical protein
MKTRLFLVAALGVSLVPLLVMGQGRPKTLHTPLVGFEEVPAVSTSARGGFEARIDGANTQMSYVLQYENLTGNVTQSHIHFGARATNGGISIWLCGTAANPGPVGTPVCPASGTVVRTVTAADVVGPSGQGIAAGEFSEILEAMRAGAAYVNVHTTTSPGGEIRGQLREN